MRIFRTSERVSLWVRVKCWLSLLH